MDSPLRAQKQAAEYAMEASIISCSKEIQDATVGRKVDVDSLLGLKVLFSKPIRNVEQLSQVQHIVTCFREN